MMSDYLLIDGGQSGCRVIYMADGKHVGSGRGAGLSRRAQDRTEGLLRALERAFADIEPLPTAVDAVVAGLTGFDDSPETGRAIAEGIRSLVCAARVVVTNDAVTSYLGAIGFEPGAVVAAGTGVIALAGDRDGNFARSDGWGYMLGDDGGGYYIGRRGLASALRAHDGRGGSEVLRRRVKNRLGPPEVIKRCVYGAINPVSEVAKFAPEVAEAAREGDPVALQIWADAAREVASTAAASLRRVFAPDASVAVSWTGSLFQAHDLMLQPFKRHVASMWPSARLRVPEGTALRGAELLARSNSCPMFETLTHIVEK
jgi:N-acetylglucosamine kinase-like BadF-type ATPase